ncbi:MAG: beta-ketoacyl-ACP synthase II [Anaerolineae bacterium]|nr:beta-ketoacyl-ACP synthase II [Anaerolineae bacterium]
MNADPAAGADRAPALRRPQERVVVTGVGVVSSVGVGVHTFWPSIVAGKSGVSVHELYKGSIYPTWISSHLPDYEAPDFIDRRELRHMARFSVFALDATRQALADAGLPSNLADMDAGVLLGTAVGGLDVTVDAMDVMRAKGGMRVSPTYIVTSPCNMASYHVAETFRVLGYNNTVVTACAAGTQALGEAANVIRRGDAEIMVAGGTEAGLCELSVAAFSVIRAFSRRNEEPERASRPFDIARDGFVAGEGAAIFILERLDLALARGAAIHGEVLGYGASNDAYHRIAPDPTAAGAVRAIRSALRSAGITPEQVDYINAHATSTPQGDIAETKAIKAVLGDRAYQVPVSGTKSMIGHLFGAAGAVEGLVTLLALRDGVLPPTINLDDPDPECDLDYVPHRARRSPIRTALSNSFGLGGQNAVVAMARYDGPGARDAADLSAVLP